MEVAAAALEHADQIAAIHVRSWQAAYKDILAGSYLESLSIERRADAWRAALRDGAPTIHVAIEDARTIGFVSFGKCRDEAATAERGEIWAIYVEPEYWGRGAGRALLWQALSALRSLRFAVVSLWVLDRNERGIRFYERAGFTRIHGSSRRFELGGVQVEEVAYQCCHAD
ncbi:MAG: GNAT family N-acetyltransferase [Rubrivivax sp.]|nr:GNAT family N-acetyltransferase [Rubrivivax sp.]